MAEQRIGKGGIDHSRNVEFIEDINGKRVFEQSLDIPYQLRRMAQSEFWRNWIKGENTDV